MSDDYELVALANGQKTLFSARYGEKMHPGLGPAAEAEVLYVRPLRLRERLRARPGAFTVWDVGLGGAANAVALLRATRDLPGELRLVSFDNTVEPLEFARRHAAALGYAVGYEPELAELARARRVVFENGRIKVRWEFVLGDFPAVVATGLRQAGEPGRVPGGAGEGLRTLEAASAGPGTAPVLPPPDAIFYDAFSPAKNPAMWTLPHFENLFRALDPARPCALTTYTRSTLIRATLLLAGFQVGVGHATGLKEETTVAANVPALITEPLGPRWLERARRSDSAEPLREPVYGRKPLEPATAQKLARHAQFRQ